MSDPARRAAYDVLRAVRLEDAYTNLVLPEMLRRHGLAGRDAAFATELASGTIRQQGTYDAIIDACLTRPRLEAKVRDVLRLGCHQVLAMRVPDHAAISTSVDLARTVVGRGPTGLVNAVLRKVAGHDLAGWIRRVAPADPVGFAAVAWSHPEWIVRELTACCPDVDALLAADNEAPAVTLVARPGLAARDELPGEPTRFSPYGVTSAGGDPADIPAVAEGRAGVQDEGSQLVAIAAASVPVAGRDDRWLDLCAGPGGKAALLAALARERGAHLVANEAQEHRAELVRRAVGDAAEVTVHDGRHTPWEPGSFDRVLVDAPCSGLGALRRRPEARWRKQPSDLEALVPLQRDLLVSGLRLVRPGGVVLYATCSPVLAETSGVVEAVLTSRSDASLEPVTFGPVVGAIPGSAGPLEHTVQLWPHRHRTDAMFMAALRRA